jgi:sugar phosphate isomerase/epimerase
MKRKNSQTISRRNFLGTTATTVAAISFSPLAFSCSGGDSGSKFGGVQIGVITYSWRSMPGTAADIIKYCTEGGISSLELMGNVVEEYAGIPAMPPRPKRGVEQTDEQKEAYIEARDKAIVAQKEWRLSNNMEKYKELRKMFNDAGIQIPIVKFSPSRWSDEEIDYAFKAAKVMGSQGITNEIGEEACKRLGKFAEKHDMYAIYHNHTQPGKPGFSFDDFLAHSPKNMLNFDVGHYIGATGKHPNEVIERLHDRIFSIHIKDKTSKTTTPPNTNRPWGNGDTPLADILNLIKEKKWPIYCDIELEYEVPADSDAQKEIIKCVQYCKEILS